LRGAVMHTSPTAVLGRTIDVDAPPAPSPARAQVKKAPVPRVPRWYLALGFVPLLVAAGMWLRFSHSSLPRRDVSSVDVSASRPSSDDAAAPVAGGDGKATAEPPLAIVANQRSADEMCTRMEVSARKSKGAPNGKEQSAEDHMRCVVHVTQMSIEDPEEFKCIDSCSRLSSSASAMECTMGCVLKSKTFNDVQKNGTDTTSKAPPGSASAQIEACQEQPQGWDSACLQRLYTANVAGADSAYFEACAGRPCDRSCPQYRGDDICGNM
jgi:hypothetical protein